MPAESSNATQMNPSLQAHLAVMSEKCIKCQLCQKECAFLRKYGKPKDIADAYDSSDRKCQGMPFECSLCGLCGSVCPVHVNPAEMFLEMRRETVRRGMGEFPEHEPLIGYERRGISRRYSYYALPRGCDTVFFPGCTLSGTRAGRVLDTYRLLCESVPNLGIVLDCCTKPSHDLGRETFFATVFGEMRDFLKDNGVRKIIVACPNCYKVFSTHAGNLRIATVYELLAHLPAPSATEPKRTVTIHDPCVLRNEEGVQKAVRKLMTDRGIAVEEMPHSGGRTLCCGEGGAVGFVAPDLAGTWTDMRRDESGGRRIVTYCAGCANLLGKTTATSHLLDVIFEPDAAMAGRVKTTKPPLTYLKRLRLKRHLRRIVDAAVSRERVVPEAKASRGLLKLVIFIVFIVGVLVAVKATDLQKYLDQEVLRTTIQGYGAVAPAVYMLIYTIAPALFLPGLPISIVGGILFGPFWGVVYTITSATAGACVAFLISRYLARQWVEGKLRSPRWRSLDEGVQRHGWKIVALTRLVPLFPFNLLNYAFGLTKVKFAHYAVATFIFMLPGCIAYIVFSSSLLDLLKGQVSPAFVVGLLLILLVSLIPLIYRRYKSSGR